MATDHWLKYIIWATDKALGPELTEFLGWYVRHPILLKPVKFLLNLLFCAKFCLLSFVNKRDRWIQVPRVGRPYFLIICTIPKCGLVRDGWETASKTNKEKVREKPCRAPDGCVCVLQSQEQIWCYRNSSVSHSGFGSHIFGHIKQLTKGRHKLRLCQKTWTMQAPSGRQSDWLTTTAHLITVLLFFC